MVNDNDINKIVTVRELKFDTLTQSMKIICINNIRIKIIANFHTYTFSTKNFYASVMDKYGVWYKVATIQDINYSIPNVVFDDVKLKVYSSEFTKAMEDYLLELYKL